MDRAIDAPAARELRIGGVDDGVDVERRNVGDQDLQAGRRGLTP
jgi:hypothetical protein